MATDGIGVTSVDGKTVTYELGIRLTGPLVPLSIPCPHCGAVAVRQSGTMTLGGQERPVVIERCTGCGKTPGQGPESPSTADPGA